MDPDAQRTVDKETGKRQAGMKAAEMIGNDMVIGLGTGSTVLYAMEILSKRVRDGLRIQGVPTSYQAAIRAHEFGIPLTTLDDYPSLDYAIDGADQVDASLCLIKGRGAAQLREKCVADAADRFIVVVDSGKLVKILTAPVPLEVLPFAIRPVTESVRKAGGTPMLRKGIKKDGPVITDNGNMVLDCSFGDIQNPGRLERELSMIPGVLCSGIFSMFTGKTTVIVGGPDGVRVLGR
ncbi:MAG TPA: ribose-5-phosphate isomerase RpiA [Methanoregulaceae archaeon]|nr:ribose-5-phosphate isomerase RpiA [Methanoregulaceae archaeon]